MLCGAATTSIASNSSFQTLHYSVTMAPIENLSDKIKITIGRLLRDADVISKKVLTVFDPSKDTDVNIAKLAKLNRAELDALAAYLKVPVVSSESKKKLYSTRKKLAKRIVFEIRSFYPSFCSECASEYAVMPGNQPRHRCWICLQGAHDCEDFTAKMEVYLSQPGQPNGLVWLCSDCVAVNSCSGESDEPPSGIATPTLSIENDKSRSDTASIQNSSSVSNQNQSSHSLEADQLASKLEDAKREQEKSESKPNSCKHVCPRLYEGTCPHGISGKKAAEGKDKCDLFHPKRCWKYMRHYTHETKGCKDGENCAYLHVNLCKSSVDTKKCKNVDCKLMHLVGTKRPKSMLKKKGISKGAAPAKSAQDKTSSNPKHGKAGVKISSNPKKSQQKGSQDKEDFLGMKSLLDDMKTTVLGEIKSLKTEMDLQKQQIETLMKSRIHSVQSQLAGQYGLYRPTPYGTQQCQHLCQQRTENFSEPMLNQPILYPPNMTPIRPAYC